MKKSISTLLLILTLALPLSAEPSATPIQLSFFSPLQLFNAERDVKGIRMGLLFAKNRNVSGLDLGNSYNEVTGDFSGIQIGSFNDVRQNAKGIQISPFLNWVLGSAHGIQIAVFGMNFVDGGGAGVQLSMGINAVSPGYDYYGIQVSPLMFNVGSVTGLQAALIANGGYASYTTHGNVRTYEGGEAGGKNRGIQLAGMANNAQVLKGIQLSSLNNRATVVNGIQLCGLANRARSHMTGIQAGAINSATHMRGLQLGIINYARTMTGLQLGVLNIIKEGPVSILPAINFSINYDPR